MKIIRDAYYYCFYKLYKHYEKGPSVWLSDWKASLTLDVLVFFTFYAALLYYNIFVDRNFNFDTKYTKLIFAILYIVCIALPNYFLFNHNNQWKRIIDRYDQLPKQKNLIGGWIVFVLVVLIIANLIFAYYLMSLIDWSQYR